MNKIDSEELNNGLVDDNLDGGGDLVNDAADYTSDYDMLVGELEKERNRINKIF